MDHFEKPLSSERIYDGVIVKLRRDKALLENGSTAVREVIDHPGGAGILAVDSEDNVFLVRQFRYPYADTLLEIPAGKLESGEDAFTCAKRELQEEAGCTAANWTPLGVLYPTPAYLTEVISVFLARDLTQCAQKLDADEFLTLVKLPFEHAVAKCLNGEIRDAKTLVALLRCNEMRRQGLL